MKPLKCEVRLVSVAQEDLYEIIAYVAADNPAAAESMVTAFEKNLAQLTRNPKLGRIPREPELAKLGYRYLVKENYLIFHTVDRKTVLIHRIIHGAPDYTSIL